MPASLYPARVEKARQYEGTYRCGRRTLRIAAQGRRLSLRRGNREVPLERRAPDSFYAAHPEFDLFLLEFERTKGRVVELFHGGDWYVNQRYAGPREFEVPRHWSAFCGHFRTRNPELSNFRVVLRKGHLALIIAWGTSETLVPIGDDVFRVGEDPLSPETLRFSAVNEGRALRADYSGCPYFRTFTP